ncbi:L-lactate dehydrogenase [Sinomonas sp. B1-1]|uniref:L-lactate dehydrogenase n=1 Tax=Sinomonas sp. B1-1 TaxID=3141454 RepID=UPI003D2B1F2E
MAAQAGKLVVVGAGAVGSSTAYAALIRGSARDVVLYDIDQAKVDAEVLDLAHGTQFTGASSITGGTDISLTAGADVVVITAGAKQKPGQTRLELAGTNARILEALMPQLLEHSPEAVFVLVTNPCDVLTVVAQRIAGLPAGRVFASGTVLDTSRLRWLLGERVGVSRSSVHAYIVGEHGDTEFPLWACATIGGVPLRDWAADGGGKAFSPEALEELAQQVRTAAYRVIEGKGATNYAIGLSAARIVEAVLGREDAVLPVSTVLSGQHGIDGVALSLPSVVGAGGVRRVLEVPMDDGELARLARSAEALRASARSLGY